MQNQHDDPTQWNAQCRHVDSHQLNVQSQHVSMLTHVNGMCRVSKFYRQRYRALYAGRTGLIGQHTGHRRSDWLKLGIPGERL